MMKCSSQLIITEKGEVLRNSLVFYNAEKCANEYQSIMQQSHEAARTIFYDGIISPPVHSMKFRNPAFLNSISSTDYVSVYHLLNRSTLPDTPFIFDFETESVPEINQLLADNYEHFQSVSLLDFIVACCVLPCQITGIMDHSEKRLLWKGSDMVQKKITANIQIAVI